MTVLTFRALYLNLSKHRFKFTPSRRCFNCGSTSHAVRSCPEPLNHALIALSRALYQFHHGAGNTESGRLHVAEDWKLQRLRWLDEFIPGEVRGTLLREALGLREGDPGEDAPWLYNMLDWGYPRGWVSLKDPKELVLERIISGTGFQDDDDEMGDFNVFGDDGDVETLQLQSPRMSTSEDTATSVPFPLTPSQRWATFRTPLFSSALLFVYTGRPLPPLDDNQSPSGIANVKLLRETSDVALEATSNRGMAENKKGDLDVTIVHPWRYPGAFDAFGPRGWAEAYARELERRAANLREVEKLASTVSPEPPLSPESADENAGDEDRDMEMSD